MWLSTKTNAGLNCGGPPSLGMILMQSLRSSFLSSSKNAIGSTSGDAIVESTSSMVMASKAGAHSACGAADATPVVDPMASPSTMAEIATLVLPMLFPRAQIVAGRCPPDEAASFSRLNVAVKRDGLRTFRTVDAQAASLRRRRSSTNEPIASPPSAMTGMTIRALGIVPPHCPS